MGGVTSACYFMDSRVVVPMDLDAHFSRQPDRVCEGKHTTTV